MLPTTTVVCIGDSLTNGGTTGGYPKELQKLLSQCEPGRNWRLENAGVQGSGVSEWLSKHMSSTSFRSILALGCDLMVVMLGTNDAQTGFGFSEQQFAKSLMQLVQRLMVEAPGAGLLLMIPPPVVPGCSFSQFFDLHVINSVFPRIIPRTAAAIGVGCIDCFSALGGTVPNHQAFSDGVHLDKIGNQLIASALVDTVLRKVGFGFASAAANNLGGASTPMPPRIRSWSDPVHGQVIAQVAAPRMAGNQACNNVHRQNTFNLHAVTNSSPQRQRRPSKIISQGSYVPPCDADSILSPSKRAQHAFVPPSGNDSSTPTSIVGLQVGSCCDVFSKSVGQWFAGKITQVKDGHLCAEFSGLDGRLKEKWMPIDHPDLRLHNKSNIASTHYQKLSRDRACEQDIASAHYQKLAVDRVGEVDFAGAHYKKLAADRVVPVNLSDMHQGMRQHE